MSADERIAEVLAALAEYDEADLMAALALIASPKPTAQPTPERRYLPLSGPTSPTPVRSSVRFV
jgi:hypothetical protein